MTAKQHTESGNSPPALYLNASQVAELVGVDATTVYRWSSTYPDLPALRIGGIVRFHRAKLLAWLESHEQGRRRRPAHITSGGHAA